jgi:transmembrane protein EpsG
MELILTDITSAAISTSQDMYKAHARYPLLKSMLWLVIFFGLTTFSVFQVFGNSNDRLQYIRYLQLTNLASDKSSPNDLFFRFAHTLNKEYFGNTTIIIFGIYAFIGIGLKIQAIKKYSKYAFISLAIYFLTYFWLHDYTQIRAGVASGFALIAVCNLETKKYIKYFLYILLAICFHWSAIIYIIIFPLFFLPNRVIQIFVILSFLASIVGFDLSKIIILLTSSPAINTYFYIHSGHVAGINVLNSLSLTSVVIYFFYSYILKRTHCDLNNQYKLKICGLSLVAYFMFSCLQLPVVAYRLYEILNIVYIILLPEIMVSVKEKYAIQITIFLYPVLFFGNFMLRVWVR